jgi:hypothetical protein
MALLVGAAAQRPLRAQDFRFTPRLQPEARVEGLVARHSGVAAMAGVNAPFGYYIRAGVAVGAGVVDGNAGAQRTLRADLAVRFLLDPFAEHPWGPYAGGGLTVRRDGNAAAEAGVLLILGVETARRPRWTPAIELGLGRGARLALVLRQSRRNGR